MEKEGRKQKITTAIASLHKYLKGEEALVMVTKVYSIKDVSEESLLVIKNEKSFSRKIGKVWNGFPVVIKGMVKN